jgi:hypothetical protein
VIQRVFVERGYERSAHGVQSFLELASGAERAAGQGSRRCSDRARAHLTILGEHPDALREPSRRGDAWRVLFRAAAERYLPPRCAERPNSVRGSSLRPAPTKLREVCVPSSVRSPILVLGGNPHGLVLRLSHHRRRRRARWRRFREEPLRPQAEPSLLQAEELEVIDEERGRQQERPRASGDTPESATDNGWSACHSKPGLGACPVRPGHPSAITGGVGHK